jgi:hypothetical protein
MRRRARITSFRANLDNFDRTFAPEKLITAMFSMFNDLGTGVSMVVIG